MQIFPMQHLNRIIYRHTELVSGKHWNMTSKKIKRKNRQKKATDLTVKSVYKPDKCSTNKNVCRNSKSKIWNHSSDTAAEARLPHQAPFRRSYRTPCFVAFLACRGVLAVCTNSALNSGSEVPISVCG